MGDVVHPGALGRDVAPGQNHDGAVGVALGAPGLLANLVHEAGPLDDEQLPGLEAEGAGGEVGSLEDGGKVFVRDAALGVVALAGKALGEGFDEGLAVGLFLLVAHGLLLLSARGMRVRVAGVRSCAGCVCAAVCGLGMRDSHVRRAPRPLESGRVTCVYPTRATLKQSGWRRQRLAVAPCRGARECDKSSGRKCDKSSGRKCDSGRFTDSLHARVVKNVMMVKRTSGCGRARSSVDGRLHGQRRD